MPSRCLATFVRALRLGAIAVPALALAGIALAQATRVPATRPAASAPLAGAEVQTSALVNQALDAPINLDERNRPLPEVLKAIQDAAFVPFHVDERTWALLPYGRDTPITATVQNTSLRKTLEEITKTLGLSFALRGEDVTIRPLPALARTGRRATVQEIAGLDLLASVRLDLLEERPRTDVLLEAVDSKLQQLDTQAREANRPEPGFAVENRLVGDAPRAAPVNVPRNATLLNALEAMAEQSGATWYPWGDTFVVMPKSAWVRRQLDAPVNLTYDRVEIEQVLHDLQEAAGVPFAVEPGAIQRVPAEYRRVRLFLENATVREALDSLGGLTGLGYAVNDDGLYLSVGTAAPPANGVTPAAGERPILTIPLEDGGTLLIYPSELPEDLRQALAARKKAAIDDLRRSLTTRPGN